MTPRHSHRLAAHLLLAVWIFGVGLPLVERQHVSDVDVACGDVAWPGAGSAVKLSEGAPGTADDHCAVCHLQRAFRSAFISATTLIPSVERLAAPPVVAQTAASANCFPHLSSRAPPRL